MKLTMFKRVKPRGFNYKPIHYDPVREEREKRRKELLGEDANSPYDSAEGKEYRPGQYIRSGGIRRTRPGISSREAGKRRTSTIRGMIALGVLAALMVWFYAGPRAAVLTLAFVLALMLIVFRMGNNNRK